MRKVGKCNAGLRKAHDMRHNARMSATNAPFWVIPTGEGESPAGSPSPEDVQAGISAGLQVFSEIFGLVVGIVGNIAVLADGTRVPVSELGVTTVNEEPLPPENEEWIEGVPNVATIGFGLLALLGVALVLK